MTPRLVADRFITSGTRWIDLATADRVRLHIATGAAPIAELEWADRSAALANLRHPLLNPLLDFGALDTTRRFEAYEARHPLTSGGSSALRLLAHGVRFLQAHAIALSAPAADLVLRPIVPGRPLRGRPFGIVLQRRPVLDALEDALDTAGPGGASAIQVCGEAGSGLRTLQLLTARAARVRGYVPVAIDAIHGLPWLGDALIDRHVCVLGAENTHPAATESVARFLARLGRTSTRRHVVITFGRTPCGGRRRLQIEPMGVRAMTSMIYIDPEEGPAAQDLFTAARDADGSPGLFLSRLRAAHFAPHEPRVLVVHETVEPYVIDPAPVIPQPVATRPRRSGGAIRRALSRGTLLAARGRHMAASRLLSRAVRVLQGRGDPRGAAECAYRLGSLDLDRGRTASAAVFFERARELAPDTPLALSASVGLGLAWLDDGRLIEAEALFRTVMVSAAAMPAVDLELEATRALARSLYWQGRYDEAAGVLRPILDVTSGWRVAALALAARVHLAQGSLQQGTHAARRSLDEATANGGARLRVSAHRAMAAALAACGDVPGAREHINQALTAAREAHQPLAALRVRVTWLEILAGTRCGSTTARRLAGRMKAVACTAAVPRLLRFQIGIALERAVAGEPDAFVSEFEEHRGGRRPPAVRHPEGNLVAELGALIELCHAAPDDRSALDRLCSALADQLRAASLLIIAASDRRVVAHAGRAWHGEPLVAVRALAGAAGETLEGLHDPKQAAEAVRYAGEIIAAIAARWIAGTELDPQRTSGLLKAGALACAPNVRAVLDCIEPEPPGPAGMDLLGDSAPIVALRHAAMRAARAPFPVLIEGESGSGKELVARAIHRLGPRRDRRFCAVNCAALADDLLEAELFGHTRGAFTGAVGERAGLFEEADGGTLFLDEVGELSPRAQAKLLRVLQDGEVRRVGENFPRRVDVRIVAATNRSLEQDVTAGRFRADLRFRLDVVRIQVPPLRDRAADIPLLATHFWNDASARVGSRATLSGEALAALARFDWPGNVRELQNVIAWMAVHSPRRGRIGAAGLPASLATAAAFSAVSFDAAREEFERRFVRGALARANGHRARAAQAMGVTRQGLAKMMRRLRIDETVKGKGEG